MLIYYQEATDSVGPVKSSVTDDELLKSTIFEHEAAIR